MESNFRSGKQDSEDVNQLSDQTQNLDYKGSSPIVKIEVEKREGEDFPDLIRHSSVFMNNKIVLFGGQNSKYQTNNVFNIYNLEQEVWSQKNLQGELNEIPKPRYRHTANVVGNQIFIIGGNGVGKDKNVYQIDFDTQKCKIIGNIADSVWGHTADVYKKSIYLFGGCNSYTYKSTSMIQKFNLQTNECEVTKLDGFKPEVRWGHRSIILQDHLYVFGGYAHPNYFKDLFSIDLSNNVSTEIDQHGLIPSPRSNFSFFAFENQLYLFGDLSLEEYGQDFYCFNVKSKTWKTQETQNQKCLLKRAFNSTVVVKESSRKLKVYLIGGKDINNSFHKNMNILTLSSNDIFWILHYLDNTGIQTLIGLNMIQEIIEMFE